MEPKGLCVVSFSCSSFFCPAGTLHEDHTKDRYRQRGAMSLLASSLWASSLFFFYFFLLFEDGGWVLCTPYVPSSFRRSRGGGGRVGILTYVVYLDWSSFDLFIFFLSLFLCVRNWETSLSGLGCFQGSLFCCLLPTFSHPITHPIPSARTCTIESLSPPPLSPPLSISPSPR